MDRIVSFFKGMFRPKECASCKAKSEHVEYLQKLIDQLLIKNGMSGLKEPRIIEESESEKKQRKLDEAHQAEIDSLEELHIYGGDE